MMDTLAEILRLAGEYEQQLPNAPGPAAVPTGSEIARWIDHTLLKPEATAMQVKTLCDEARQFGFASVCINPSYVPLAAGLLSNSNVQVCTVIGFPLGATLPAQKSLETMACLSEGAEEIDMVLNIGALKGQAYGLVMNDILAVCQAAHNQRALVKVILETCLLTRQEKIIACLICKAAGAEFVKTSTGFNAAGATVEDVELMRSVIGPEMGVKAAGGIRNLAAAHAMIQAGATRLGTSAGVQICKEAVS